MTDRDPRAVARDQAHRTMTALEPDVQAAVETALDNVAAGFARRLTAAIDPDILAALAGLWVQELPGILTVVEAVYDRAWGVTGRRFTPDPPWTVPGVVDDYLRTAENRLTLVGDDLWQAARLELADGVEAGESIPELTQRLQDTFASGGAQLGESRATLIARSEVVSAWNKASKDSLRALPDGQRPRFQTWVCTLDERTRSQHWAVDGVRVPIDSPFTVGGEQLDFPGDPNGSPAAVLNCRCVATFSFDDEPMDDEGRQFLSDEEIAELDRERPGRGQDADLAAANLTTSSNSAAGRGPGARNREPEPMTQMDAVVSTVTAGGHWTAPDVAYRSEVPLPAVRTYLARAVETGRLQRVERGVYAAATTEVAWHTPYPTALAFEGLETGDGRIFAPDAIYWEGESWPLQWAEKMLTGHEGAELAGAITETTRLGDRIPGRGRLYVDTEAGGKLHGLLERDAPIGVSVDLDDISVEVRANTDGEDDEPVEVMVASASVMHTGDGWRIVTREAPALVAAGLTAAAGDGDDTEATEVIYSETAGDTLARITRGRLRGATAVVLPALSDARIVLGDGPLEPPELSAAVTGDVDLPIHEDRELAWDGPAAASRVLEWAQRGDPGEEEIARRLSQAFLYRDDQANPATLSAYSLGVADVFGEEIHIVPRADSAAAGSRGVDALEGISEDDRDRLRARVCGLYTRLAETFDDDELVCPWRRDEAASDDEGEVMSELEASAHQAMHAIPPQPAAWFTEPTETELPAGSGGVHYVDGRVYGWVAQAGVPHAVLNHTIEELGDLDLSHFLRAGLDLDDGTLVKVGAMTMDVGHHRDGAECETAACQFDDTRTVGAIVTVGQNERGLWFSGAAAPWLDEWSSLVFTTCQPSYHMQQARDGRWQLRAVLTVPVPAHSHPLLASVVNDSNVALAASAAQAEAATAQAITSAAASRGAVEVEVRPVINWDDIDTDEGGRRSLEALAVAVVDEMERRDKARTEAEQLRTQMALLEADMLTDVMQGDQ